MNNTITSFKDFTELDETTFKKVTRIRGGKVQRNIKVASKPGFRMQGGKAVKMKPAEKRARKKALRVTVRKRKAKQALINIKTAKSNKLRSMKGF